MNSKPSPLRALITGASSGIGAATALAFARAGIAVLLVSRSADKLQAVAAQITASGGQVETCVLDLSQVTRVRLAIQAIVGEKLDILVNCAGMGYTSPLAAMPLADWQALFDLNVTSVWQVILGALPALHASTQSTIINVTSIAAKTPFPTWGAYSASKAALVALSQALAAEERAAGVRVVIVAPGAVNTPLWDTDTVDADFNRQAMLTPETVAESILHAATAPAGAVVEELVVMPSAGVL
ncbi:MAG: SDR family oxidoreductase [Spirulinaceae cyanobacterium RM2_2_10]|nr:SDR family oxidoreductase [Spirulinaceae cyanobacterium SM2_1_0]NJO21322.1 SDR family oxidoreductase [Spirulinaceae cyanobacterium RM2_2_10]